MHHLRSILYSLEVINIIQVFVLSRSIVKCNLLLLANISFSISLTVPARVTKLQRTVTSTVGSQTRIPCTARGIPRPRITWRRKDRQRLTGQVTNTNTRYGDYVTSTITISRVQTRDAGVYICTATNVVSVYGEVRLTVQGTSTSAITF